MKNPASLDAAPFTEEEKARIRNYKPAYSWEPHPYAPFMLQNQGAEIRRVKARIADLEREAEKTAAMIASTGEASKEETFEGFRFREDREENRYMFAFPGKPERFVRELLGSHAFRWSPSRSAYVRKISPNARWAADRIIGILNNQR